MSPVACRLSPAACDCGRSDEIVLGGRLVDVPHVARRRSHVGHDRSQHPRHLSAILVVAIGAKFAGAEAGAHLAGAAPRASLALGALMNTRGLMELVVLNIGFELGVMEPRLYTLFVVMAIVTTVMTDPLVRWIRPPLDLRLRAGR